jgi:MoaD family protein
MGNFGTDGNINRKATVRYFGSVRALTHLSQEEVEIPAVHSVYELLRVLSDRYGEVFMYEVFKKDGKDLRDDITIAVNGIFADQTNIMGSMMESGDVITLFPVFPGGG